MKKASAAVTPGWPEVRTPRREENLTCGERIVA
jgi:hypothetical protein